MQLDKKKLIKYTVYATIIICISILCYKFLPTLKSLKTQQGRDNFAEFLQSKGVLGFLIFVLIQIFQVVIFFIPGEFIELLGGMIYGTFLGFIACSIGCILGSAIVYISVKKIGKNRVSSLFKKDSFNKYAFLQNEQKLSMIVFILYFIPGTPKDVLTFFVPFTNIKLSKFLIISMIARIPSVISSTFIGANLQRGNFIFAIVLYIIIGAIGVLGIIYNKNFLSLKK